MKSWKPLSAARGARRQGEVSELRAGGVGCAQPGPAGPRLTPPPLGKLLLPHGVLALESREGTRASRRVEDQREALRKKQLP